MSRVRKRQPPLAIPDSPEEIHPKEETDIQLSKLRNNFDMLWSKYTYLTSDNGFFTTEYFTGILSERLPLTFENAVNNQAVFTDDGGELASRDITGKGKVVMDHNPFGHGIWTIPHIRNLDNDLILQENGLQDIDCFGASAAGSTPAFTVSGYRAADALRTLSISVGATVADQVDFTGLATYYFGGAITATGGIVPGGNITMADDEWIGLGGAAGRLVFDATPAPDALNFQNCDVNMFNNSVLGETPLLSIYGWAAFGALRSLQISCGSAGDDIAYFNGVSSYGFNGDLIIYGNNIQDAAGAWIDSDGAGNTTFGGNIDVNGNDIIIDADGDSYIHEAADDNIAIVTASNEMLRIGLNGISIEKATFETVPANQTVLQLGATGMFMSETAVFTDRSLHVSQNAYYDGAWKTIVTDESSNYYQSAGTHVFRVSNGVDAADTAIGWIAALTLQNTGPAIFGYDITVTGNNILDAGGAWIDSDGGGNTTAQGNLTTTGHLGVDIAAATDRTLYVSDTALSITTTYYGIQNAHTKTAGVTTEADDLLGNYNTVEMNHNGSVIGTLLALAGIATLTDGTIGDGEEDLIGVFGAAIIAGGTADHNMIGVQSRVVGSAGTVSNDIAGVYTVVGIDAGMTAIGGNVYGYYLDMDVDQDPVGSAYGLYMNCQTNVDYGIYQLGALYNYFGAVLHCPDGAVGAPAYSFFNDTDTGMYRIGADNLGLAVNGTLGLEIDANGNVIVANDLTVTERIMMPGRLEALDGFLTDVAARAAPDSIAADFHIFVTPSDVDHDYFAFSDKLDGQTIMVTNDGSVTANVDADEGGGAGGFVVCINETLLAKWDVTDDSWYTVRG